MHRLFAANNLTLEATSNRVILSQFVIEADGSITNIRILRGQVVEVVGSLWRPTETIEVSQSVKEEATRFIQSMPKWIPGEMNGRAVRTRWTLPIPFHLE